MDGSSSVCGIAHASALDDWTFADDFGAVHFRRENLELEPVSQRRPMDHWRGTGHVFHATGQRLGGEPMVGSGLERGVVPGLGLWLWTLVVPL